MATRENFIKYMRMSGLSASTIDRYANQVPNNFEVQAVLNRLAGTRNIYGVTNRSILRRAAEEIRGMAFDEIGHSMYSAGIKKYIQFLNTL